MVQDRHDTTNVCAVCGGNRWWCSRMGQRICQHCDQDLLLALQKLADGVQGECSLGIDYHEERLPQETMREKLEGRYAPGSLG